ncbi:SdpI family protein [Corynebacterium pacaense]|uniref:SdpI family protein n=1 Tax=Corynebacterium pacaense TaxID=1816684 RepID=UPI0009BA9837|nr:SdpI family protein [Corynebacterium pacaense]
MTVIGIILGSLFGALAFLLIVTGVLAWTAKLPGNPAVGIRVPEVRKSQDLWEMAHRVAGPLWTLAGVSLGIASMIAFIAGSWMWIIVVAAVIASLVFIGMGAGMGAHTVAMVDAKRHSEEIRAARDAHPELPVERPEPEPMEEAPKPPVDLDALRRAMRNSAE